MVACQNIRARCGGSPVSRLNRKGFQGDGAAGAVGMSHDALACRDQARVLENAFVARRVAPAADGLVGVTWLPQTKQGASSTTGMQNPIQVDSLRRGAWSMGINVIRCCCLRASEQDSYQRLLVRLSTLPARVLLGTSRIFTPYLRW